MAEPKCPYFGKCNGCTAQHIDYEIQLENKRKALARAVKFEDAGVGVFSGSEFGYRNRLDFFFHDSGLGLRNKNNPSSIVDIEECVIANKRINEMLSELRNFFKNANSFDLKKRKGVFRQAIIRAPENDSAICFILNNEDPGIEPAVQKIKEFAESTTSNNVLVLYVDSESENNFSEEFEVVKGSEIISENYLGKTFCFSAQGFFQNNHEMAERMHEYCNELLKNDLFSIFEMPDMPKQGAASPDGVLRVATLASRSLRSATSPRDAQESIPESISTLRMLNKYSEHNTKDAHLLDLYAGVGTFGIINSDLFKSTTIVESVKPAIECASKNIRENNIKNANAIALDAKQLRRITLQKPLFVITDPPRSGMDEKTIKTLKSLKPEVIIYISCNVQQLAKDIPKFRNYKVKSAALFDLFPQTPHSEAVVEMVRNS